MEADNNPEPRENLHEIVPVQMEQDNDGGIAGQANEPPRLE